MEISLWSFSSGSLVELGDEGVEVGGEGGLEVRISVFSQLMADSLSGS